MNEDSIIRWHQLFGHMFDLLLTPLGIQVDVEASVMSDPPRVDVLLLRKSLPTWTDEQLRFLPDGIRDSKSSHILIEFKRTESVTSDGLLKTAMYDLLYRQSHRLSKEAVATFIISAKKPQKATLDELGFTSTESAGIYKCTNVLAERVQLLSLNELPTELNNVFYQLFATQRKVLIKAETVVEELVITDISDELAWYVAGLQKHLLPSQGASKMSQVITPQMVTEMGRDWLLSMIPTLPPKEVAKRVDINELAPYFELEQLLKNFPPEQIKAYLTELEQTKN